jgi:hypothetical protein
MSHKIGNEGTDLLKIMAVVLVVVVQGGRQLLCAPGAKDADQSVLITS